MFLLNQIAKGSACKVTNYVFKEGTSNDSVIELHAVRKCEYQQKLCEKKGPLSFQMRMQDNKI
jgi:hypothetical protein